MNVTGVQPGDVYLSPSHPLGALRWLSLWLVIWCVMDPPLESLSRRLVGRIRMAQAGIMQHPYCSTRIVVVVPSGDTLDGAALKQCVGVILQGKNLS